MKSSKIILLVFFSCFQYVFTQQRDNISVIHKGVDASISQHLKTNAERLKNELGLTNFSAHISLGLYWKRTIEGTYYLEIKALSVLNSFSFNVVSGPSTTGRIVHFRQEPTIKTGSFTIHNIVWQLVNFETNTKKTLQFNLNGSWMQDRWTTTITNTKDGDLLYQSIPLFGQKEVFEKTLQKKLKPTNQAYYYNPNRDYIKWNEWTIEVVNPGEMTINSFPVYDIRNYIQKYKNNTKKSTSSFSDTKTKKSKYTISTKPKTKKSTSSSFTYKPNTYSYNPNLSAEANEAIRREIEKQNFDTQRILNEQRRIYYKKQKEEKENQKKIEDKKRKDRLRYLEEKRIADKDKKRLEESIRNNKKDEENFNLSFENGLQAYSNGYYQDAIIFFEKAMDINPQDVNAHYNLGISYLGFKDYKNAEKYLSSTLLMNPNLPWANYSYALTLLNQEEPILDAMKKLGKSPKEVNQFNDLVFKRKKLLNNALLYLEREYSLDKNKISVNKLLYAIYNEFGMYKEAKNLNLKN